MRDCKYSVPNVSANIGFSKIARLLKKGGHTQLMIPEVADFDREPEVNRIFFKFFGTEKFVFTAIAPLLWMQSTLHTLISLTDFSY